MAVLGKTTQASTFLDSRFPAKGRWRRENTDTGRRAKDGVRWASVVGGDVFSLQRILGHSSLEVVRLYINLAASDISEQHRRFSPVDNMNTGSKRRSYGVPDRLMQLDFSK